MIALYQYLNGALMTSYLAIAVFFFRFSVRTNDRLFRYFSLAFLMLGIERIAFAFSGNPNSEGWAIFYLIRLSGFALIFVGILHKNRKSI